MTQPGSYGYGAPQDAITRLVRDVENLQRQVREMQSLQVYSGTVQSPNFDGDASTNTVGTMGYGLDGPTGNAVFNTIALRSGIIGDDALANPVSTLVHDDNNTNFAVPNAGAIVVTTTITVPAGFSQALVLATGSTEAFNTTGGTDFLTIQVGVNGAFSSGMQAQALSGAIATVPNSQAKQLTGLVGGSTFTTTIRASVNGATTWTAGIANAARLSTIVVFLR